MIILIVAIDSKGALMDSFVTNMRVGHHCNVQMWETWPHGNQWAMIRVRGEESMLACVKAGDSCAHAINDLQKCFHRSPSDLDYSSHHTSLNPLPS